MNDLSSLAEEVKKIKYQIKLISETIDPTTYPIQNLVIELDWNKEDLNKAHDIFEKYFEKMEAQEEFNWTSFEHELREAFNIGYQTVKIIILAFYRNNQWVKVCEGYAAEYDVVEFKEINKSKNG